MIRTIIDIASGILAILGMLAFGIMIAYLVSGCSSIEPDAVRVEAAHNSHLLQHSPWLTDWSRDQPGFDTVGLDVHWQRGRAALDVGEYYTPECLDGQHEVFEGRVSYELWHK